MNPPPTISIVIPTYDSHATLAGCLEAIDRQSLRAYEVIVVDSGPSDETARIVRERFPWVVFERAPGRLLPHAARNRGVELSSAEVIVFTDPDIYPQEDWLASLYAAYRRTMGIVVGSVGCHGHRWLDLGIHLSKFDMWLPGSPPGTTDIAPTLNLLCPRSIFSDVGGFLGKYMIGDTLFSWKAISRGYNIAFEPGAVVFHHHVASWKELLRERYSRGAEFGLARAEQRDWGRGRIVLHLLLSVAPVRLAGLMARTVRHALEAGMLTVALMTSPIILTAHAAWLAGESRAYVSVLSRSS